MFQYIAQADDKPWQPGPYDGVELKILHKDESTGAVTGTVRQGTFSANSMRADLESRTVRLDGNARLRIDPRATK